MFKLHQVCLKQIKAAIRAFGTIWFHGDMNLYHTKKNSDDRQIFQNDPNGPGTYRIKFTDISQVPADLKGLEELLQKSRSQELARDRKAAVEKENVVLLPDYDEEEVAPSTTAAGLKNLTSEKAEKDEDPGFVVNKSEKRQDIDDPGEGEEGGEGEKGHGDEKGKDEKPTGKVKQTGKGKK